MNIIINCEVVTLLETQGLIIRIRKTYLQKSIVNS